MAALDINISDVQFLPVPNTYRFIDRTGFRYNNLTVSGYLGNRGTKKSFWLCRCDCGRTVEVPAGNLVSDNTTSCGCQSSRHAIKNLNLTHGLTGTPEFRIWSGMRNRCNNPRNNSFADYGKRGITVCDRWESFENFLADMGNRPGTKYTVERVNNELGYCPSNCKWILKSAQAKNKRNTIRVTFRGETKGLVDWCQDLHVNPKLVRNRLRKGWSVEDALTSPLRINQFG